MLHLCKLLGNGRKESIFASMLSKKTMYSRKTGNPRRAHNELVKLGSLALSSEDIIPEKAKQILSSSASSKPPLNHHIDREVADSLRDQGGNRSLGHLFQSHRKLDSNFYPGSEKEPFDESSEGFLPGKEALQSPDWWDLGLSKHVHRALMEFLDNPRSKPTVVQHQLIPKLIDLDNRRNILLSCQTGSGKTLAYVVSLINLRRVDTSVTLRKGRVGQPAPTAHLIVVPTCSLALQVYNWIIALYKIIDRHYVEDGCKTYRNKHDVDDDDDVDDDGKQDKNHDLMKQRVQMLAGPRSMGLDDMDLVEQGLVPKVIPKILIGTPKRLLEEVRKYNIELQYLETVILDECDSLIQAPKSGATNVRKNNWNKIHPPPTIELFREIRNLRRDQNVKTPWKVVALSATVDSATRHYLVKTNIMNAPIVIKIGLSYSPPIQISHFFIDLWPHLPADLTAVEEDAKAKENLFKVDDGKESSFSQQKTLLNAERLARSKLQRQVANENFPAILTHLMRQAGVQDVLVILPAKQSSQTLIRILKQASFYTSYLSDESVIKKYQSKKLLPLSETSDWDPNNLRVFVCNEIDVRGMDTTFISLAVVFGVLENVATYIHAAGRVGRLDKPGQVVSILCNMQEKMIFNNLGRICNTVEFGEMVLPSNVVISDSTSIAANSIDIKPECVKVYGSQEIIDPVPDSSAGKPHSDPSNHPNHTRPNPMPNDNVVSMFSVSSGFKIVKNERSKELQNMSKYEKPSDYFRSSSISLGKNQDNSDDHLSLMMKGEKRFDDQRTSRKFNGQSDRPRNENYQKDKFQSGIYKKDKFQSGIYQKDKFQSGTYKKDKFQSGIYQKDKFHYQSDRSQDENFHQRKSNNQNFQNNDPTFPTSFGSSSSQKTGKKPFNGCSAYHKNRENNQFKGTRNENHRKFPYASNKGN